jgi:hypothetical protein
MCKRRRIWFALIALVGVALAAYFEPTNCVRGWLRGEAFYDGRPTSYWAAEIQRWDTLFEVAGGAPHDQYCKYSRRHGWPRWLEYSLPAPEWPKLLDGDPDGLPVLLELADHPDWNVQEWVRVGMRRIQHPGKEDKGPWRYCGIPDT